MRNPVTILCALALTAFVVSLPLVLDAQEAEEPAPTPQIWPEYQDEVSKSEALRSLRGNFEVEWVETSGDKGNETKVTYKGSASRLPMLGRDALEEKLMLASEDGSVLRVHHMIYGFSEASGNFIVTWLADRQAAPWILEGKTKKRDTVFSLKYSAGGGAKKISVEREIEVD
ncbi:MAG: hypothetical protein KDB07_12655, partial [Planctomycetes bacterium]|nr:hypothetical protein [Planctomycetota bacterium]